MKKQEETRRGKLKLIANFSLIFDPELANVSTQATDEVGTPTLDVNMAAVVTQAYKKNFKESIQKAAEECPEATHEELVQSLVTGYWKEGLQNICDALADGDEPQVRLVEVVIDAVEIGAAEALGLEDEEILELKQQTRDRRGIYRAGVEGSRNSFLQSLTKSIEESALAPSVELIEAMHQLVGEGIIEAFDAALQEDDFVESESRLALLEGLLMASTQLAEQIAGKSVLMCID